MNREILPFPISVSPIRSYPFPHVSLQFILHSSLSPLYPLFPVSPLPPSYLEVQTGQKAEAGGAQGAGADHRRHGEVVKWSVFILSFSSLDDHAECLTVQFYIYPFTHTFIQCIYVQHFFLWLGVIQGSVSCLRTLWYSEWGRLGTNCQTFWLRTTALIPEPQPPLLVTVGTHLFGLGEEMQRPGSWKLCDSTTAHLPVLPWSCSHRGNLGYLGHWIMFQQSSQQHFYYKLAWISCDWNHMTSCGSQKGWGMSIRNPSPWNWMTRSMS